MGKIIFAQVKAFIKNFGDDFLEIFFDDEITATQDFVLNNFAVTSLVNAAGLLILFSVVIWFHNEIKYGKMSLSLDGKINRSTFRYAFAGNSFMCVVMFVVTIAGLLRFAEMNAPLTDTENLIAFLYLVEWLTFLIIGLTFVVFGTIWAAARFRDANDSPWKAALLFVPIANLFALKALLFKESSLSPDDAETTEPLIKSLASRFGAAMGVPLLIFIAAMGALEYSNLSAPKVVADTRSDDLVAPVQENVTSNGIFVGTQDGNDFYILPETFSGDKEKFKVTAEYINESTNRKDQIDFYFVHYRTGWIFYDNINENLKTHVNKLRANDVVRQIWDYCMQVKLEGAILTPTEPTPPKEPTYRYPAQHENGRLVWAGYMKGFGCYLDTQSVHVLDNTN
ncbi:MAG: DUF805 domain-containing protein [Selenomonadaceae bacterium]|nr:DUF805 domain-containing protein [Selenomonadaceae bacterium]